MENNKPNDWFLAIAENPTYDFEDFEAAGITIENTQFKSKEFYKNSDYIKEMYTDESGKFNEVAFNSHYEAIAKAYNVYAAGEYEKGVLDDLEWDPYDSLRPNDAKTKTPEFSIVREINPLHQIQGFGRVEMTSNPKITASEAAQKSKVFDWETQEFKDYSPNDRALENSVLGFIKSIAEPLVMATYEEDGYHIDPFSNRRVKHSKGEYKINDQGEYYYETLGGRSAYGKEIKSVFDSLTVDGSTANNYDFFDSDGLDKSVTGTIAKTVAVVAPLFTPLAPYYGYAMIGTQMLDLLPSLYNSTIGVFVETPEFINEMQGIGKSFRGSTSQYSKNHLLSAENFFTMVSDVALQWQQQMTIAKLYKRFSGVNKKTKAIQEEMKDMAQKKAQEKGILSVMESGDFSEEALKKGVLANLGKSLKASQEIVSKTKLEPLLKANNKMAARYSMGYMAAMQGFQMYEDALAIGASKGEAALLTWGTIAGMYGVMRTGLGELFLDDLQDVGKIANKKAIKTLVDEISKGYQVVKTEPDKVSKAFKLLNVGKKAGEKFWRGVKEHTLPFYGKMIGEGIEETSEEMVMDFFKHTHNILAELGITSTENRFNLDDWKERYLMSFVGGAIGGGVFGAADVINKIKAPKDLNQELTYLLRNGKKDELLGELDNFRKKGKLGNTKLSTRFQEGSEPGDYYYESAEDEKDTQNEANYKLLKGYIESIDKTIHQEKLDFTDEQILDKLINADQRLFAVQQAIGKNGINGRMLQRFNNITEEVIKKQQEIEDFINSVQDIEKRKNPEYETKLEELQKEKQELLKERDDFFSSENLVEYTNMLLFEINSNVNKVYYDANLQLYIEGHTGKKMSDLDEDTIKRYSKKYDVFKKASLDTKFKEAYTIFKNLNKIFTSDINDQDLTYEQYGKLVEFVRSELIDQELTEIKFNEKLKLEDLQKLQFSGLNEIIKDKYRFLSIEDINPNASEEEKLEYEERKGQIFKHNSEVLDNLIELVQKFKEIGFIDNNIKHTLLQTFDNLVLAIDWAKLKEQIVQEFIKTDIGTYLDQAEFMDAENDEERTLPEELKKYLIEVISKLDGSDSTLENYKQDHFNSYYDDSVLEEYDFDESVYAFLSEINAKLKENGLINLVNEFKNILNTTVSNPLYNFLQKLSLNINGAYSNTIQLLEEEDKKINKIPLDEYELDGKIIEDIDQALKLLDIAESLVNAADSTELGADKLFGHNSVINDFSREQGKPTEYGTIRSNHAYMLREDIQALRNKLNFIKNLNNINSANTFKANQITGNRIVYLLLNSLKGNGEYEKLKSIEVNGIKLLDGVDDIDTPEFDKSLIDKISSDNIHNELTEIANKIRQNYLQILSSEQVPGRANKKLISSILKVFDKEVLIDQNTSRLDSKITALTDYDVVNHLLAICSYQKAVFDKHVLEICQRDDIKFIPLYPQLYVSYISCAKLKNQALFNELLEQVKVDSPKSGCDLVPIKNSHFISGISGVGKTSVVAKIVYEIMKLEHKGNNFISWNAAPKQSQIDNLNKNIPSDASFSVEDLIKHIVGEPTYGELQQGLENIDKKSNLFKCEFIDVGNSQASVYTIDTDKFKFNTDNKPNFIYIDEYTFTNSIYAQILEFYATQTGAQIIYIGDIRQSGYSNKKMDNGKRYHIVGPTKQVTSGIRTPELNVSMRPANIHKKKNNELLEQLTRLYVDFRPGIDKEEEVAKKIENLVKESSLVYYKGDESILAGDIIVSSISEQEILKVLRDSESLIYIYDNTSSNTYKIIQKISKEHPELSNKLKQLSPQEVQGNEADYAIVDVSWKDDNYLYQRTLNKINTLLTRGLEGSFVINSGFLEIFPINISKASYYARTPKNEDILASYKDYMLNILQQTSQLAIDLSQNANTNEEEDEDKEEEKEEEDTSKDPEGPMPDDVRAKLNEHALNVARDIKNNPNIEGYDVFYEDINKVISDLAVNHKHKNKDVRNFANRIAGIRDKVKKAKKELQSNQAARKKQLNDRLNEDLNRVEKLSDDFNDSKRTIIDEINQLREKLKNSELNDDDIQNLNQIEDQIQNINNRQNITGTEDSIAILNDVYSKPIEPKQFTPRSYGFYDRTGNENEDWGFFNFLVRAKNLPSSYTEQDKIDLINQYHKSFKGFFIQGGDPTTEEDAKILANQIGEPTNENLIKALRNGQYQIIVSKFNSRYDHSNSSGWNGENSPNYLFRLVYSFNYNGKQKDITLGILGDPESWKKNTKNYRNKEDAENSLKAAENYEIWYKGRIQDCNNSPDNAVRYTIDKKQLNPTSFSRIYNDVESYDLPLFEDRNKGAIKSGIYVFSGQEGRLKVIIDKLRANGININSDASDWKGKAIVFACPYPYVKIKGTFINPDNDKIIVDGWVKVTDTNIDSLYLHMMEQGQDAAIRALQLSPNGMYVIDQWDTSVDQNGEAAKGDNISMYGYLHLNLSEDKEKNNKLLGDVGNKNTGLKMLFGLYKYKQLLSVFLSNVEESEENIRALNEGNELYYDSVKNPEKYAKSMTFRLPTKDEANRYGNLRIIIKDNYVISSYTGAKLQLQIIDSILSQCNVPLAYQLIEANPHIYTKEDEIRFINTIDKDLIPIKPVYQENGQEIILDADEDINFESGENFSTQDTYNLIYFLSAINKFYCIQADNPHDSKIITIKSKLKDGIDREVNLAHDIFTDDAKQILEKNGCTKASFLRNLLSTVFHGRPDPYAGSKYGNARVEIDPLWFAPFPQGIFYHARYRYKEDKNKNNAQDYYPIKEIEDNSVGHHDSIEKRFHLNCTLQQGVINLLGDLPTKPRDFKNNYEIIDIPIESFVEKNEIFEQSDPLKNEDFSMEKDVFEEDDYEEDDEDVISDEDINAAQESDINPNNSDESTSEKDPFDTSEYFETECNI